MEDLDVAQLAAYLHLTPDQVSKMAMRERVPGRRVGGEWRFSEAEIHHWLEERIGVGDIEDLDKVQAVLDRAASVSDGQHHSDTRSISELCSIERIAIPLEARTRGSVIRSMCELAGNGGLMWDAPAMADAVQAREQLHPTALDSGVALLHPRRPQTSILADSILALGVCTSAIPFSDRGHATDVFFLICSFSDAIHLRILARLSRMLADAELLSALRQSQSPSDAWQSLQAAETRLDESKSG